MKIFGKILKSFFLPTLVVGISFFTFSVKASDKVIVYNAWVREPPPNARVHAGYATLRNKSLKPVSIVAISSPNYEKVEIHLSKIQDGIAVMKRIESITIPAGGKVECKPGALHFMLIDPHRKPRVGETVKLIFEFSTDTIQEYAAVFKKRDALSHAPFHKGH